MGSQNPNPNLIAVGSYSAWSSVANSYNGCWVSLTSKSEIRYEGILSGFNPEDDSIALLEVRCFGTEGRKRDGPQIPTIDRVYEYIIFRGTDMKDFLVMSSTPVHPSLEFYNDTDAIQSQHPCPLTTSTSLPSTVSGSLTDLNPHTRQPGLRWSNFQGPLPLYQPGGNSGSSGACSPAPYSTGDGAPYGLPQLQQRSLLRPPPDLSVPSSLQQPMPYCNFSPSLKAVSSNFRKLTVVPVSTCTPTVTSASLPLTTFPPVPPLPPASSAILASEVLPVTVTNRAPNVSTSAVALPASLPSPTPLTNSDLYINALVSSISSKPIADSGSSLPYQAESKLSPAVLGSSSSIRTETPAPTLITPGQLLQPRQTLVPSPQSSQTASKNGELAQVSLTLSPESSLAVSAETDSPKLPLPVTSGPSHRPGKAPMEIHYDYNYRGRGRGRGTVGWRPVTRLTEDFGLIGMNGEFKKGEAQDLGKCNKSSDFYPNCDKNPVDNEDDFSDSLSSSVQDNSSQCGMTRHPEQTFGEFTRYHGGRARGGYYGRGTRGGYYGRGGRYGRGRGGRGMPYPGGY